MRYILLLLICLITAPSFSQFKAGLTLDALFPKSQSVEGATEVESDLGYKVGVLASYQICSFISLNSGMTTGQIGRRYSIGVIGINGRTKKTAVDCRYNIIGIPAYIEVSDYTKNLSPFFDFGIEKQFATEAGYSSNQTCYLGAFGLLKRAGSVDLRFAIKYTADAKGKDSSLGINYFGLGFSFLYRFKHN
jgi:hypothetical protein